MPRNHNIPNPGASRGSLSVLAHTACVPRRGPVSGLCGAVWTASGAWTVVEVLGLDRSGQHTAQGTLGLSALAFSQTFDNNTFIDDFPSCIVDFIFGLLTPRVSRSPSNPLSVAHCGAHRAIRARSGWQTACADCLARSGTARATSVTAVHRRSPQNPPRGPKKMAKSGLSLFTAICRSDAPELVVVVVACGGHKECVL